MGEPTGILYNTDRMAADGLRALAARVEALGFESLWLPELTGREPVALAGYLLAHTRRLTVATGIANVYVRDAVAAAAAATTLAELSDSRFLLGLGVSNVMFNTARGHTWQAPVAKMSAYLSAMRAAKLACPPADYPVYVAAHGPKLLALAANMADGANTYLMTLDHARNAREILGPDQALNTMLMCLVSEDPESARGLIRKALAMYIGLDYYHRAWRALGFSDDDFDNGGSDRLIDALVAWGSLDDVRARIQAQRDAGSSRVILIPLNAAGAGEPDWGLMEALAG